MRAAKPCNTCQIILKYFGYNGENVEEDCHIKDVFLIEVVEH